MVELSGKSDPYQHGFPNVVFIVPAIIVIGLSGCLRLKMSQEIASEDDIYLGDLQNLQPPDINGMDLEWLEKLGMSREKLLEMFKKLNVDVNDPNMFKEFEQYQKKMAVGSVPYLSLGPRVDTCLIVFVSFILASIFAFFGYKLYKNLVDKERRREEKAKAKQGKKKK